MFKVNREKVRLSASPYAPPPEWYDELDPEPEPDIPAPDGEPASDGEAVDYVGEAREQAGLIIAEAEAEAARILEDAGTRAGEMRRKAYDEGFLEGHVEGDKKAAEEFEAIAAENKTAVERVLAEFFAAREAALKEIGDAKDEIKPLIFEMVKKIINVSYENDDKFFERLVKSALEKIKPEGKLTLTVSEADYERFFPSGGAIFSVNGKKISAEVTKNASLGRMELVIDAGGVTVNAGPEAKLRRVGAALERRRAL
ncbi:MAG: hypothetical protein LBD92_06750 [Oscillospiraceae bacterium]|nr:hypothetical protein [Oscillospiraceae bacterium]